jgi:hypothetical protein
VLYTLARSSLYFMIEVFDEGLRDVNLVSAT